MSTTTTETSTSASSPKYTSLSRVASIPIVHDSLGTVDGVLSSNSYLRSPYTAAKNISASALKLTEPLQERLAPYINQADGYVNKGLDVVQDKFPYPFEAKTEDVANYARERRQSLTNYAAKAYNNNVKTPAVNVAQGIDQKFAPIVNYFESAVSYLPGNGAGSSTPSDAKYQYQRAFALSKSIPGNLYVYSSEHFKQLQEHNKLVQSATESVQTFTNFASIPVAAAQARFHQMVTELTKLRESSTSLTEKNLPIPARAREAYVELSDKLSPVISELRNIASRDAPISEKFQLATNEVKDNVSPLLETIQARVAEYLPRGKEELTPSGQSGSHENADAHEVESNHES